LGIFHRSPAIALAPAASDISRRTALDRRLIFVEGVVVAT
jgi:hypothetical protein